MVIFSLNFVRNRLMLNLIYQKQYRADFVMTSILLHSKSLAIKYVKITATEH